VNFLASAVVAVIELNLDGVHTAGKVALLDPPTPWEWIACVQEFQAPEIRCYAVNVETMELRYEDHRIVD
jgi:hypothetical protein